MIALKPRLRTLVLTSTASRVSNGIDRAITVCFPFFGATIGGSKISALLLVEELDRRGIQTLIALHRRGHLSEELDRRGIPWVFAPKTKDIATMSRIGRFVAPFISARRLTKFLRKNNVDIVHANDLHTHLHWSVGTSLSGAKFVWHQRDRLNTRTALFSLFADAIPVISNYCQRELPSYMRRRTRLVKNPFRTYEGAFDKGEARRYVRTKIGATSDSIVVGFVSDFIDRKRPELFVEIAWRVLQLRPTTRFVMVGDARNPLAARVQARLDSLEISDRCDIIGRQFPIEPWIMGLDVIVCPAVREPFGRVLVESGLMKTPVVASNDGGHREVIENGTSGLLVPVDDVRAFSEAIAYLLDNPAKAADFTDKAKKIVSGRFSLEIHADKIMKLYRDIA